MKIALKLYTILAYLHAYLQLQLRRMRIESPRIKKNVTEVYCFLNNEGTVYDLLPLYDLEDYIFEGHNNTYILNFCKFTTNKCRKDNTFIISHSSLDEHDCHLMTGTNPTLPSKWTIVSNQHIT